MRAAVLAFAILIPATASADRVARAAAAVKPKREQNCDILEYGLYVSESAPVRYADPSSVTGERFEIDGVRFTQQTKVIPAELGRGFGFRYRLRSVPKNKQFFETVRVVYPKPVRGATQWEHKTPRSSTDGTLVEHLLYDFVYSYEVVPGEWKFQILVDNQTACTISFNVK